MSRVARIFRLHLALWLGLAVMAAAGAASPQAWGWPLRLAVAWDAGVTAFLLLTFVRLSRARSVAAIRARAAELDQAGGAVLPLSLLAAGASVFVIVYLAASGGGPTAGAAVLTVATIALSWLFVQMIFALHYAHEFYARSDKGRGDREGLMFPGESEADYWDFLHFAVVIGVANQTADVQISSQRLRRIATVHSVIAWLFNTVILALAVNLAVNLL